MKYDCNLTGKGPTWNFYKGFPPEKRLEFAIFALTPGMPAEYVNFLLYITPMDRKKAFAIVNELRHEAEPLAMENAGTITIEDGWKMISAVRKRRNYNGIIPHWSALALQEITREKGIAPIAEELRVTRFTIMKWKTSQFHPLTLHRMIGPRFPWTRHYRDPA